MKDKLMRIALAAAVLLPLSANATLVTVGNTQWQQPNLLTDFSWNEIAEVCPSDGTACAGSLNAIDVTGWTWASVSEVASLFAGMDGHPGNRGAHSETGSIWAPEFLSMFNPTLQAPGASIVHGWTRSADQFNGFYTVYMFDHHSAGATDVTRVRRLQDSGISSDMIGAWLYRGIETTAVPEPGPTSLMALGMLTLMVARRRSAPVVIRR